MDISQISAHLSQHHYWHGRHFRELIHIEADEEQSFRAYWSNLVRDEAFKEYTHRERRILRYRLLPCGQLQMDRNAEYKSSVVYPINYRQGVNALTYSEDGFIAHPIMQQLLATDIAALGAALAGHSYAIDIHQFRVRTDSETSSPTTSGIHQDGLDWVFMHFIDACNTVPVVSDIYATQEADSCLLSVPMERFLETIVLDDNVLYHRAGDVQQMARQQPAWRDLLLVGFRRLANDAEETAHAEG
ncbi:2OG-Fe dioxygenase family protein [Pseudomonas sp. NFXW11]|uniref:2OG-Fe dioxygenase family protein n=1 Tax=Pseudomonas sp. NFXW11 TaxID=2819531 RepID=UPI003CFA916B